jgi:hypothetical protein
MLHELCEYEAPDPRRALGTGQALPLPAGFDPVLSRLAYMFHGRSAEAPALTLAGGVLESGRPVSGAGHGAAQALTRLMGEAAELIALGAEGAGASSEGLGAGPDRDHAARHGLLELMERDAVARW